MWSSYIYKVKSDEMKVRKKENSNGKDGNGNSQSLEEEILRRINQYGELGLSVIKQKELNKEKEWKHTGPRSVG